jgi:hypothetical protein
MESSIFARRPAPCAEFPNDNPGLHHGAIWSCVDVRGEAVCERPVPVPSSLGEALDASVPAVAPALLQDSPVQDSPVIALPRWFEAVLDDSLTSARSEADTALFDASEPVGEEASIEAAVHASDDDDLEPIEIVDELSFDGAFEGVIDEQQSVSGAIDQDSGGPPATEDAFERLVHEVETVARVHGADDACIAVLRALFGSTRLDGIQPTDRALEALLVGGVVVQGPRGIARSTAFTEQVVAWRGMVGGESDEFPACGALDEWTADVIARALGSATRADVIRRELRRHGVAAFGLVAA